MCPATLEQGEGETLEQFVALSYLHDLQVQPKSSMQSERIGHFMSTRTHAVSNQKRAPMWDVQVVRATIWYCIDDRHRCFVSLKDLVFLLALPRSLHLTYL